MFVITTDQIGSRSRVDAVQHMLRQLTNAHTEQLTLPPERTAGDELEVMTADAATAVRVVLDLTRSGEWSVGLGVGGVRMPLPQSIREATGPAFWCARDAVTRAKREPTSFALEGVQRPGMWIDARDVESIFTLLLTMRARRSQAGWEIYDLMHSGMTQASAASELGISAPSASARARAAGVRVETEAVPTLVKLLSELNRVTEDSDEDSDAGGGA